LSRHRRHRRFRTDACRRADIAVRVSRPAASRRAIAGVCLAVAARAGLDPAPPLHDAQGPIRTATVPATVVDAVVEDGEAKGQSTAPRRLFEAMSSWNQE
jgi:hypothetical protein